jgi:hypothetical protein
MSDEKFKIKWCPVCDQGWVVVAKDKTTKILFCYCLECETEWKQPLDIGVKAGAHNHFGVATEPSVEDIRLLGWDEYLK